MKQSFQTIFYWILRILAALIMLQTLFFKFSGAEESVYIFTQMHVEPWGRYLTGVFELIASILILYRPTIFFGALIAFGIMSGAILSHLTILGIEIIMTKVFYSFTHVLYGLQLLFFCGEINIVC